MKNAITISFVGNTQIKNWLEQWAKEEDRTISATLRQILTQESLRRQLQPSRQEVKYKTN
ncbi:MAG: hypothetical protein FOGNACKC_05202 [Anaerolineae bacterium]|nr:hypothetical protein [Anaerolineae bacterium]